MNPNTPSMKKKSFKTIATTMRVMMAVANNAGVNTGGNSPGANTVSTLDPSAYVADGASTMRSSSPPLDGTTPTTNTTSSGASRAKGVGGDASLAGKDAASAAPGSGASNYRVYIRVRPFLPNDRDPLDPTGFPLPPFEFHNGKECVFIDQATGMPKENFLFDGAFCSITPEQWARVPDLSALPPDSPFFPKPMTQQGMYETCAKPIVSYVLDGYNASILAYGQTSSGKTHTMTGISGNNGEDEGIIPRLCRDLLMGAASALEDARSNPANPGTMMAASMRSPQHSPRGGVPAGVQSLAKLQLADFSMEIAYFEIYNENVLDLLDNNTGGVMAASVGIGGGTGGAGGHQHRKRKVRSHPVLGVYIDGLTYENVTSWEQCAKLIAKGVTRRHVASTKMNDQSSRSHAVMQLRMTQTELSELGPLQRRSNVHLADLAGSERIKLSQVEGDRLKEAAQINLSLTTLRRVIDALIAPKSKNEMVPYRDSLLTWVLSDSLGGNAKSCMIATLCPNPLYGEESFYTLQYASRAKSIVSNVVRNEDQMAQMIRNLQQTIAKEAAAAAAGGLGNGGGLNGGMTAEQVAEMKEKEERLDKLTIDHEDLQKDYALTKRELETMRISLRGAEERLLDTQQRLEDEEYARQRVEEARNTMFEELDRLRNDFVAVGERAQIAENNGAELTDINSDLRFRLEEVEAQLQHLVSERSSVEARARYEAAASYMPMLRWYQGVMAALDEAFFHSQRSSYTAAVINTAVHQCTTLHKQLVKQQGAVGQVLQSVRNAEAVNKTSQETMARVSSTYVRVRDYLHLYGGGGLLTGGTTMTHGVTTPNATIQNLLNPTDRFTQFAPSKGGAIPSTMTVREMLASFYAFVHAAEREEGIVATAMALNLKGDLRKHAANGSPALYAPNSSFLNTGGVVLSSSSPSSISRQQRASVHTTNADPHASPHPSMLFAANGEPRKYAAAAAAASARAASVATTANTSMQQQQQMADDERQQFATILAELQHENELLQKQLMDMKRTHSTKSLQQMLHGSHHSGGSGGSPASPHRGSIGRGTSSSASGGGGGGSSTPADDLHCLPSPQPRSGSQQFGGKANSVDFGGTMMGSTTRTYTATTALLGGSSSTLGNQVSGSAYTPRSNATTADSPMSNTAGGGGGASAAIAAPPLQATRKLSSASIVNTSAEDTTATAVSTIKAKGQISSSDREVPWYERPDTTLKPAAPVGASSASDATAGRGSEARGASATPTGTSVNWWDEPHPTKAAAVPSPSDDAHGTTVGSLDVKSKKKKKSKKEKGEDDGHADDGDKKAKGDKSDKKDKTDKHEKKEKKDKSHKRDKAGRGEEGGSAYDGAPTLTQSGTLEMMSSDDWMADTGGTLRSATGRSSV